MGNWGFCHPYKWVVKHQNPLPWPRLCDGSLLVRFPSAKLRHRRMDTSIDAIFHGLGFPNVIEERPKNVIIHESTAIIRWHSMWLIQWMVGLCKFAWSLWNKYCHRWVNRKRDPRKAYQASHLDSCRLNSLNETANHEKLSTHLKHVVWNALFTMFLYKFTLVFINHSIMVSIMFNP